MRWNAFYLSTKDKKASQTVSACFLKLGLLHKKEDTKIVRKRSTKVKFLSESCELAIDRVYELKY